MNHDHTFPREVVEIYEGIKNMSIRGAGRIAKYAVIALMKAAEDYKGGEARDFLQYMERVGSYLKTPGLRQFLLPNALTYVLSRLRKLNITSVEEGKQAVINLAQEFVRKADEALKIIGELGSRRIENGDVLMTHCHSTAAVSVIVTAHRKGKVNVVYVKETRPAFQGLITAKALAEEGLEVIVIPDSSVRYFMKKVDKVVVGADTVAANGAVVNKIGTSLVALAAKEARVRFYVATETFKFSPYTLLGELVPIEVRDPREIVEEEWIKENERVKIFNPVFDVTPPEYVDAIITEKGVIPPQAALLLLTEDYGIDLREIGMNPPATYEE